MNVVLKRVFIALALVAVCVVILAATRSYGIWVITGFAVFLFILGVLRKEKTPDKADAVREDSEKKSEEE
jgi:flagellar biosynthesis component FlhA